ncbi:MAG: biotin/lipoyl-binding protein, partial [Candidatus Electrothrix sp. AR4]|nr:biotin/lipoyl-binding protein [Candidatus Electrothrix sp. AR4]
MEVKPKTVRGRIVWFFLENLPGFMFILLLVGISIFLGRGVETKKAVQEEELTVATAGETPAINVVILNLEPKRLRDKINLPGMVEPWTRLELMAKVGGSIEEVFVQEGDHVKKGERIARIETRDYQIALDSAKAAYALAKADYTRNKTLRKRGVYTQPRT